MKKITGVTAGEEFKDRAGRPYAVGPACTENQGYWYCVNHQEPFENQMQKDGHIQSGAHKLAWFCRACSQFEAGQ